MNTRLAPAPKKARCVPRLTRRPVLERLERRDLLSADPSIAWSTYLGGDSEDFGYFATVDHAGNLWATGYTRGGFPTPDGFQHNSNGGMDVFVAQLGPTGQLAWSTLLGGSSDEIGNGIAVDREGSVFITGYTHSTNFPTTANAYAPVSNGSKDAFVAKITADGTLAWSTFLGGSGSDQALKLTIDSVGNCVVVGSTASSSFPTTDDAADPTYNGGSGQYGDVFITKLTSSGQLLWSTYWGGSADEYGCAVAVDAADNVLVAGITLSHDFPVPGGFDPTYAGNTDGFIAKFSPSGERIWSSYLGGSAQDGIGTALAVNPSGSVVITGTTCSHDFPTPHGYDQTWHNSHDGFVAQVTDAGELAWATFLGGSHDDSASQATIDRAGNIWVTGTTNSPDFPMRGGLDTTYNGGGLYGDAFVVKMTSTGRPTWSSFFGGSGDDAGQSIGIDACDDLLVSGWTQSANIPTVGAFDATLGGGGDAYAVKITGLDMQQHHVIAAMGDSYASGEGNPTSRYLTTWLTEGVSPDKELQNLTIRTKGDDAKGDNAHYHRSPYAASVLVAQEYASNHPLSTVDLVFAPQSGATMTDMSDEKDMPDEKDVTIGAPNQVGQISDLMTAVPDNHIDVLTLSFGGNDIGFDRIVTSLLIADLLSKLGSDDIDIKTELLQAVTEGKGWGKVQEKLYLAGETQAAKSLLYWIQTVTPLTTLHDAAPLGLNSLIDDHIKDTDLTGLNNLQDKFTELQAAIERQLNPERVFITEYPVPFLDEAGNYVSVDLLLGCGISADDAEWIDDKIVKPLNIAVKKAAEINGWTYVTGITEDFQGHQYKDGDPECWFRTLWESLRYQHGYAGTLHPNEVGHQQIATLLYDAMYGAQEHSQPIVTHTLRSHADLNIYDPLGRHLGVNRTTGELEEQIPGGTLKYYLDANHDGFYDASEEQQPNSYRYIPTDWVQVATLPQLLVGEYQTELIGTSHGPFELTIEGSQNGVSLPGDTFSGTVSVNDRLVTTTTVTASDGRLVLSCEPLVAMPTMQIDPHSPERMVVTPGTTATVNVNIGEVGGSMGLHGVTIHALDLIGPWGTIPGSSVTFSSNNFDLAAGGAQSVTAACDIPADFWGIADGYLVVDSADGGSHTLDLRIQFQPLKVSPLEVTPRFPRDGSVEVNASFIEFGEHATHTVMVNWGDDGVPEPVPFDETGVFGLVAANHVYAEVGNYMITVTVTDDDGNSVSATGPVDVGNVVPVAGSDGYDVAENVVLEVTAATGVLSNDQDANEDPLRAVLVEGPQHGVLVLADDGSFTYTPAPDFNRVDSFTYQAGDGLGSSDPVTVTINVQTAYPWYNGADFLDVNDDGYISPIDALLVINELNRNGGHILSQDRARPLTRPFFDVNRDGYVVPIDALWVINHLNRGNGEGEADVMVTANDDNSWPIGELSLKHQTENAVVGCPNYVRAGAYRPLSASGEIPAIGEPFDEPGAVWSGPPNELGNGSQWFRGADLEEILERLVGNCGEEDQDELLTSFKRLPRPFGRN